MSHNPYEFPFWDFKMFQIKQFEKELLLRESYID